MILIILLSLLSLNLPITYACAAHWSTKLHFRGHSTLPRQEKSTDEELPEPRIVVIGQTGAGSINILRIFISWW